MEEDIEKYKKDCDLLELTDDELINEAKATLIDAMNRKSDGFRRPEKVALVAIENLIAENKQLKQELDSVKEIYYTQKDVENLIERNIELEGIHGTAYNAGKAVKQHQWKEKIIKLLEKLDKEEKELQNSISDEERKEYSDAMISWQLCDINSKREMLQKLLKN